MAVLNLQAFKDRIVKALTPWFLGRDQDALIEAMRQYAEETLVAVEVDTDALQDQFTNLYSNAGAGAIGTASGNSVQEELDAVGGGLAGKVNRAGDTMTGKLTNNVSIHVPSGTMVLGAPLPENLYWNYTYPGNTYLTMDKATADNDASLVFTQGGRAKWEFGATTEGPGASPRIHMKKVNNPTANPADDQFLDVMIWDYDTGNVWVNNGYKLGIGTLPQERLHVAGFNVSGARVVSKFENYNTGAGSQSAAHVFQGVGTAWNLGNDFGLNAGHNFFIQDGNSGNIRFFADANGVSIGGSTVAATEILRADSTTGGFLPPRMTTVQRDAMGGKNAGLIIYNTTASALQVWNGATWQAMASGNFVTLDTAQSVVGLKRFTGGEIAIDNFSGVPTDGVIRFGNDNNGYIWKQGSNFRFNAGSSGEATLNASGVIWTSSNLSSPMTTNTAQSVNARKSFTSGPNNINDANSNLNNLEVLGTGGAAMLTFHRPGDWAYYLGMATDRSLRYGGWSEGAASYLIWSEKTLAQPMTLNTVQTVTATKVFTAQQTVDNTTINFRNWAGVGTNGLVLLGDNSYLWKVGSEFQLYNAQGGFTATISSGGTVLTTVNASNAQDTNNGARLGRIAATVSDWNNAIDNGWYMAAGAPNAPTAGSWYIGLVTKHNDLWVTQEVWDFTAGADAPKYRRQMANGTWGPWTPRLTLNGHLAATSRVYAMEGPVDAMPAKRVAQLLYIPAVFDGGILSAYDYGTAVYKPIRIEASTLTYVDGGGNTRIAVNTTDGYRMLAIVGGLSAQGTTAQLECRDRTTNREWAWYGNGDNFYLWNGFGNILTTDTGGNLTAGTLRPSGSNTAHFAGNGSGIQMNGLMYENGTTYNLAANGAVWVRNPRVFVQSSDPGAQAADGDLWFW